MNLYRKLFGLNLMKPIEDGGDAAIGGAADRGDNFDAGDTAAAAKTADVSDEDVKVATGDENDDSTGEEDQPRDSGADDNDFLGHAAFLFSVGNGQLTPPKQPS